MSLKFLNVKVDHQPASRFPPRLPQPPIIHPAGQGRLFLGQSRRESRPSNRHLRLRDKMRGQSIRPSHPSRVPPSPARQISPSEPIKVADPEMSGETPILHSPVSVQPPRVLHPHAPSRTILCSNRHIFPARSDSRANHPPLERPFVLFSSALGFQIPRGFSFTINCSLCSEIRKINRKGAEFDKVRDDFKA
jgi:hypothetical protein